MRTGYRAWAVMAALLLSAVMTFGQAISGDIVGTVTDKSHAVIANAKVEAVNVATGVKTDVTANANGEYHFTNLPIGTYKVTATAPGFAVKAIEVLVELNKTATANMTMAVGEVSTTVEVSEMAVAINTTSSQVETTYNLTQAQDMPMAAMGSGVLNLSLLQAGVASSGGVGAGSGPSVAGQRPRNNNFTIDGVDNNDKGVTGPDFPIPNDAVADLSVLQNQYSPEFGHSTGGQFNVVVLSGSNAFHGAAYEYMQNRNLNAVDYSLANQGTLSNPRYDNNRYGGKIGGPIIKNKLFFFTLYERNPVGQAATPGSPLLAPTAAGYSTISSIGGLNQNNASVLKQFAVAPAPCSASDISGGICPAGGTTTVNGQAVQLGVLPVVAPNFSNAWTLVTSGDYNISQSDQLRVRYMKHLFSNIDTAATLPQFFIPTGSFYHLFALSEYHTFSPNVTNEFRFGLNRNGYNVTVPSFKFSGLDAFPNVTIDELGGINVGPDPNAPQYGIQNTYQFVDNVSWMKGSHSLKFGVEGRKYIAPQLFIQRARGDYYWSTLSDYLTDGQPYFAERSFGSVGYSGDEKAVYWFVNDDWRIRPNLTLNLGLRYEYTGVPFGWTQQSLNSLASVPGLITFGSPKAPKDNYMPRVGFAWSPGSSGNTSVRGGFGMGYDVLYDNIGTLSRPPQIGSTVDCPNPQLAVCPTGGFLASGGIKPSGLSGITTLSVADAKASTSSYLPDNVKYPYSIQWNLGVQHVFWKDYTFETRYMGTRGVHLNVQDRMNIVDRVVPGQYFLPLYMSAPTQAQLNALPITLNQIKARSNVRADYLAAGLTNPIVGFLPYGGSIYHGWATQLTRRFTHGLQFQAGYTWSHTIDDSTADFFSTVLTPRRPQDFQNIHPDRSNSALDHRHRFTLAAVYDMPFFKNSNWFVKNVAGNWQFSPAYTYETGEWADVQSALDANLNGDSAGDRVVFNPNGAKGTGSGVTALKNSAGATVAYLANNPNAQYIQAAPGMVANSSRNTLLMNPIDNVDFAITKRISITERVKFSFAAQMSNALNHPQFVAGYINDIGSIGRTSTAEKNYLTPGKSNFNDPKVTFPSNARTMQLAAKISF